MVTRATLNSFTLDAYRDLLAHFQRTHRFVTFAQFGDASAAQGRLVLLRHDIDYSPEHALMMAELEAEQGVKATYFLLLSSPFYNLLSPDNSSIARRISELGHEVGLHYDVAAMLSGCDSDPQALLDAQARLLGQLSGAPVASIAMHNPSTGGADIFLDAPYLNAYDARYSKQIGYFSDSCMAWRDSFVEAFNADSFPDRFQLLIHPVLWTQEVLDRDEKLERMLSATRDEARRACEPVREIWRCHSGVAEHDSREARAGGQPDG